VFIANNNQLQQKLVRMHALSSWQRNVVAIPWWRHVIGGESFIRWSSCWCWQQPDSVRQQSFIRLWSQYR